jgi:uncharacterized RDD family membrane protein YckC
MSVSTVETRGESRVSYALADVPNRLVAYVIDTTVLAGIIFVVAALVAVVAGPTIHIEAASEIDVDDTLVIVNAVIASALNAAYFVLSWTALRASPAQRLLGMRIRPQEAETAMSLGQAVTRWLLLGGPFVLATIVGLAVPAAALVLELLAAAWYLALVVSVARHPRKQGLHDRFAGTVVVKEMPAAAGWLASQPTEAPRAR